MNFTNRVLLVVVLSCASSAGQIDQTHPELCGKPGSFVPLPSGVAVTIDHAGGSASLFFGGGLNAARVELPGVVDELKQVCPLPDGNRLLLFGATSSGENLILVNARDRNIADSFQAFAPAISPDQRWLIYRKFYPRHVLDSVSEEYLLYDLNKTAAQNRPHGIGVDDQHNVGAPIFPVGMTNLNVDNLGLDESQTHRPSSTFYWARDSGAVLFGDFLKDTFSLIVVTIGSNGSTAAYQRIMQDSDLCKGDDRSLPNSYRPSIARAEIGPAENGDRIVSVDFQSAPGVCEGRTLELHLKDFDRAAAETHKVHQATHKVVVTN